METDSAVVIVVFGRVAPDKLSQGLSAFVGKARAEVSSGTTRNRCVSGVGMGSVDYINFFQTALPLQKA